MSTRANDLVREPLAAGVGFSLEGRRVKRTLKTRLGRHTQALEIDASAGTQFATEEAERAWHVQRLRGQRYSQERAVEGTLELVDLFCGAGGLSAGVTEAVRALGWRPKVALAVDQDTSALDVYSYNLRPVRTYGGSIRDLLRIEPLTGSSQAASVAPTAVEMPKWPQHVAKADLVIGGPPCQGHSNFNNHTRRTDPRNDLYLWMPAAAHRTGARILIVENVPTVKVDSGGSVDLSVSVLQALGYEIGFDGILSADHFGVAQARKRHILVAIRSDVFDAEAAEAMTTWLTEYKSPTISAMDAIGDLVEDPSATDYDVASILSPENEERVRWLNSSGQYDLPNEKRPLSHRNGHTYPSVYGRMFGDRPAQTITTGFLSPGRGRFTHPTQPRGLTPHEGARLQGFPDSFRFVGDQRGVPTRTQIARMIGDAVPPPLGFYVTFAAFNMVDWAKWTRATA